VRFFKYIDKISEWTGILTAWLIILLTAVIVNEVVCRYIFNAPTGWVYDTSWMLYSALFALGGAYTLLHKRHIRIDILYDLLSPRGKAVYDTVYYLIIFLPVMALMIRESIRFATAAWLTAEKLSTTIWFFPAAPIKTVIPVAFFLLGLQGLAEFIRNLIAAKTGKRYGT